MKYLLAPFWLLILLLSPLTQAEAGFHAGAALIEGANKPSYNYGYIQKLPDGWNIGLTTNAFINNSTDRVVISGGNAYTIKTKPLYGAVSVGKKLDRVVPSVFMAFTRVRNRVYYNNVNISNDTTHGIVFGGNVNYFLTENIAASVFYLLPNTNIGLERSFGLGVSWYY